MYAYIDDVHIVGSVDDVLAARTAFVNHLRQIELSVNLEKCSLLYFHDHTHPLTHSQLQAVRDAGLQWDADRSLYAEVLGAIIGIDAAAIARGLFVKLDGVHGLFGAFFRRVGSGGFTVQAAMLLLAHSVGRMGYLQRCLPPDRWSTGGRMQLVHGGTGVGHRVNLSLTAAHALRLHLFMSIQRQLLSAVAVAVQRGNALTMLAGFTRTTSVRAAREQHAAMLGMGESGISGGEE